MADDHGEAMCLGEIGVACTIWYTAGVGVSAGKSRHSGEGCKSLTVKVEPTTLAPSHAQASVTASAKR